MLFGCFMYRRCRRGEKKKRGKGREFMMMRVKIENDANGNLLVGFIAGGLGEVLYAARQCCPHPERESTTSLLSRGRMRNKTQGLFDKSRVCMRLDEERVETKPAKD